ncbi:MAG: hypothetical protein K0S41_3442 [Anaerocolumna sp.]|jgi:hypothetical protein|nr:hypothetical protein [Anaerocolumna sp.]
MDNSLKGLILAAGVIITCLVIGLGFFISREAKNTSNNGAGQISSMNTEYQDMDLVIYDGLLVSGKEVQELIKKTDYTTTTGLQILVKTGLNTTGKSYSATPTSFPARGNNDYINPTAQFSGLIERDANNIISKITFTQQ